MNKYNNLYIPTPILKTGILTNSLKQSIYRRPIETVPLSVAIY